MRRLATSTTAMMQMSLHQPSSQMRLSRGACNTARIYFNVEGRRADSASAVAGELSQRAPMRSRVVCDLLA